ncbi:MAG: AAA family ATPase, partial [Prevotellaceae bacterium]|nr:AAA family ATPase [Prevotellaceae bacterium]
MGKKESVDKIPNDLQLEEAVLGALIIDKQDRYEALSLLTEGCFFDPVCRQIFQTIVELNREGDITIANRLTDKVNPVKIAEISMRVGSAAHIVDHSRKLYQLFMRREYLRIASRLQSKVYDYNADVEEIMDEAQADFLKLLKFDTANVATIDNVVEGVFDVMLRNIENEAVLNGIGTGLTEFDKHSGGLQLTDLVIVAGETSQGKTSLALTIASNAAIKYGAKVAFYSLEMGKTQLGARLMAQQTGVSSKSMLTHKLDRGLIQIIYNNTTDLCNSCIYFDDSSTTNIDSILRSIRAMKAKYGINLIVVDYLQLVSASSKNTSREQQVAEVARSLKNIAKDL